jgi:hypothetical protein
MKKLVCALAAAATLVGGSWAASSSAEARPYRYYAKPGYYGAYAYPRYGYYRRYRPNVGAAVAAGVAGAVIGGAIASSVAPAYPAPAYAYPPPAYGYYGY